MNLRAPAILVASRSHGETASIARMLTEEFGLVAAYVAGGRGRQLRPVMIPGNRIEAELRAKALEWATTRGSRSGRVAFQFIQDLAGRLGKAIS